MVFYRFFLVKIIVNTNHSMKILGKMYIIVINNKVEVLCSISLHKKKFDRNVFSAVYIEI